MDIEIDSNSSFTQSLNMSGLHPIKTTDFLPWMMKLRPQYIQNHPFYLFEDSKTMDTKLDLIWFGQICPIYLGALLPAKGNHYCGKMFKVSDFPSHTVLWPPLPIIDNSMIKDIIMLLPPTNGINFLFQTFLNKPTKPEAPMLMSVKQKERKTMIIVDGLSNTDTNLDSTREWS